MEQINEDTQLIAVEKVLEEMQKAEEYLKNWNAFWYEQVLDAHCLPLHYEMGESDVREMEAKYEPRYRLANAFYSEDSIGIPLIKENIVGNNTLTGEKEVEFECEFGRIDWYGMHSHKASRNFSFHNNGDINFKKVGKAKLTMKNPTQISYETAYNVLSNDFSMEIEQSKLIKDKYQKRYKEDKILFSLSGNILTEKINDIEFILDLRTGMKKVRIAKEYDENNRNNNTSIVFEATLDSNDNLDKGNISINTYKGNGKVNGTYRIGITKDKEVDAKFYSRKGSPIDLTTHPILLGNVNNLLFPCLISQNIGNIIISSFAGAIKNTIEKNESEGAISFNTSDFNTQTLQQEEARIVETIKMIKGELPLAGLVERIDNSMDLLNSRKQETLQGKVKKLKLETNS